MLTRRAKTVSPARQMFLARKAGLKEELVGVTITVMLFLGVALFL